MLQRIASVALLSSFALAQSPLIYDNGPLQTGVGTQGPISELQTAAPLSMTTFGYSSAYTAGAPGPFYMVDQFTVNTGMVVDGIEVYGYLTGATSPSCFGVQLALFDGDPSTGTPNQLLTGLGYGAPIAVSVAGTTTGAYTASNSFTGVFRVTTGSALTNRNIQRVRVDFTGSPVTLTAGGTYYLAYAFNGISFTPPITTLNQKQTGDGLQFQSATPAYVAMTQGAAPAAGQGAPFKLFGAGGVVGSITNLGGAGGGGGTATFKTDGNPVVGGYVRADLGVVNPAAVGAIMASSIGPFGGPPQLLPCGGTWHVNPDFVFYTGTPGGNVSMEAQIPLVASLAGANLLFQGAEVDIFNQNILVCDLGFGFQFSLTDAYNYQLNLN